MRQKEALDNEARSLRGDLQRVKDDRDHQYLQVQCLTSEVEKYKECTGKSYAELDYLTKKSSELEVRFFHLPVFLAYANICILLLIFLCF